MAVILSELKMSHWVMGGTTVVSKSKTKPPLPEGEPKGHRMDSGCGTKVPNMYAKLGPWIDCSPPAKLAVYKGQAKGPRECVSK
jgi:hypothetical protein